jgi:preprotein translocase subunit YajC
VTALDLAGTLAADSSSSGGGGNPLAGLLLPVLLIALVYFGFIRPQRARARRATQTAEDIEPGRQVMTSAGIYGTVAAVEEDAVLLEIAPGVTTRWARAAIARVVPVPEALGVEEIGDPGESGEGPIDGPTDRERGSDPGGDARDGDTRNGDDPKN